MYDLRFGSSAPTARDEGIGAADSPTGEAISAEAMEDAPTSEEERLDGLLADVEEMERAQEIAAAGLSGRNADEIEAKERYVGTEAAKAVEKVVTSLRGKVKDAVTRAELEERVPEEDRKGLISQEDELIMPANEGVIDAVKAATGRDVTGYYHAVSEEKIWHAVSKHSHDSTSKVYSNQLDLTWDDFALLPDILDTGKPGVEKWKGDTVISYTKEYGNICFKVLQRIGRKRRHGTSRLMFVTEWIEKTAGRKGLAPVKARDQVPSSPGEVIQARGVEDVKGKNLVNGMYAEAGDGSVYGVARVEDLSISADVPQFKKKEVAGQREAANEDGTTHELSGGWNAKSAPIIVWRRRDGRLEVISGRHRLAHARKNGVGHIAVRVYDEDAVHDAAWAKLYDVEVNILEGTCGAIDVAFYFRHNPMSLAEAEARGLMPKTQAGGQTAASRMGIMIATRASGYVFDSLVNGGVSAEDAYMACVITESAEGQELALKARRGTKGKKRSWEYVTALVRGAEQMAPDGGGSLTDLFGFDEGFAKRAEKMANYVEAVRRQLRRRIEVLSGAGSLQRKGEMTREMGVKIDRPEDAVKIIERLARLDAAYEAMEPGLGIAAAAEAWDEGAGAPDLRFTIYDLRFGSEAPTARGELSGNSEQVGDGSFSVSARFLGTAQEAKDALRSVQGRVFRNEATGIEAMVTSDTLSKSYAAQMSVRNLMALGYSQEEARQIHYSAFAHVHEIFERADYGEFEKNYAPEQKKGRAGAWHYYGTVDIEGKGSFDVNVTAVVPDRNGGDNRLFSLELTIENPADGRLGYPHTTGPSFNAAGSSEHRLAAYRSNVEKEILKIREEAMKDGTYMKAPNGEDSKLDERTWCVVRTRAFKDYFGDWENEPEGASKVVDSNGEPLVVYHGTPEDFGNVFEDKSYADRELDDDHGNYSRGVFWFADRRFTAQTYQAGLFSDAARGKEMMKVPAAKAGSVLVNKDDTVFTFFKRKSKRNGDYTETEISPEEAFYKNGRVKPGVYGGLYLKPGKKLPSGYEGGMGGNHHGVGGAIWAFNEYTNVENLPGRRIPRTHDEAMEDLAQMELADGAQIDVPVGSRVYACFLNIRNPKVYDMKGKVFSSMGAKADEAKKEGYDGVIVKDVRDPGAYPMHVENGMSIGVFSPGQIKSVDNRGTFDAGSGDISMSVRNLAAVHTLSVFDFLNAAEKLGGMPMPSVAVTRLDKPYKWGDVDRAITLVARPDMVDPRRGTEVYSRDAWTGVMPEIGEFGEDGKDYFYDEEREEYVEATLENLTDYLYERKSRAGEAKGWDVEKVARAYLARRLRSMDEVKGERERLQGEDEVRVLSEDIVKWMNMLSERYDTWLGDDEMRGVLEALADVDEVTEGSVREAIMNWTDADGRASLWELQNSEAMEEGSDFIKETVRILNELRAEKTDYLEAVPQRAVKMNEWAYALFSDKVGNKEAVRRVCRENGIIPIEYKAGERDRALGDLIDDGEVSFSLTFSPAERSGLRALRELANGAQEARFRSDTLGQDVVFPLGSAGELKDASNPKSRVVGAFGFMHLITMRMAHGESMEEACYTACKAVMAVVNGEPEVRSNGHQIHMHLDGYKGVVIAKWQDKEQAWVITGFKEDGGKSSAGDRRKAMALAARYAPDSFGSLKEVGAALDYGIARLAQEYKQNNADPSRKAAKRYYGEGSFSVAEAKERGMMKDGVMEAGNGVLVDMTDASFSVGGMHVSPYLFKMFDLLHIGEGEGAQAFGWGLYFMTGWGVNKFYFREFAKKAKGVFSLNGKKVTGRGVLKELKKETGKEYLLKFLNGAVRGNAEEYRKLIEENRERIEEDKRRLAEAEKGYIDGKRRGESEVQREKEYLEGIIRNATNKQEAYEWLARNEVYRGEYPVNYRVELDVEDGNLLLFDEKPDVFMKAHPDVWEELKKVLRPRFVEEIEASETGDRIYYNLKSEMMSARRASEWLEAHGIRGIKYADGATRHKKGEKDYNYVIFNADYVTITHINNRHQWSEYSEGNADWERVGDVSFSVTQAKERGLFKDGVMELGNGVIVDGRGDDFSASVRGAQQASPHLFREPDLEKVGSGEGTQSQGWGLYWSTRWTANAFYHKEFSTAGEPIAPGSKEERLMRLLGEALDVEEVDERVLYDLGGAMESFGPSAMRDELYGALESKGASEEDLEFFDEAFENMEVHRSTTDEGGLWVEVESRVGGEDMFVRLNPDGKFAVNYLADLDVDDGNVLHYDEDAGRLFDEHPGLLEAYRKEGGEYTGKEKGRDVYWGLARALGSDKAASQWLDAHGIRGNKYEDGMSRGKKDGEKMYNYVIFNEDYIKITHVNNRHPWSEFSEDNPDWQKPEDVVWEEDGDFSASVRNLAAVHTLSVEKFLAAGKMGGMPLPSVAVTRLDRPYRWGNEDKDVTLVARPEMVDPEKGTQVYERDAWTGRMPRIESETLADGSEYRYFYDEDGEEVEATLENVTDYLYERKRRGNEATEREMDLVLTAKAYLARRMKDMEEVKGQRERLQEREEESVGSWVIGSWMDMLHKYDVWLGDDEWIGVFEALADLDEVTEKSVRDAIMGWTDADGRADLSALQNSEAMEEGSRFIKEAVRILRKLRAEKTDYLEAVPRRAVKMDEWAYALFSEKIPDKDEVRRVCREHGIVPVEYKAGEKKQALGDLINDAEVSFSLTQAKERGLMRDGVMELGNGVIVDGGADFSASVDFMHVSPALYRRPDREHVGEGFGAQMFGWGVLYGVTNPKENRKIFDDATIKETLFVRKRDGREESVAGKEVLEELARRGVTDEDILRSLQNYSWMGSKSYYENERKGRIKDLNTEKEILERAKRANDAQRQKIAETNIAYYEQEVAALDYLIENDIYVREGGAKRYPVNYRMRADVDDGNVLHWDEDADKFINEHPDVAEAMNVAEAGEMKDAFGDAIKMRWGKNIYFFLTKKLGSARAASEWLDAHGIRGVKYRDDATYGQENGTYNYVIFNPDYIEVIAINNRHEWSEYSEDNPDWERPEDVFGESSMSGRLGRRLRAGLRRFLGGVFGDGSFSVRGEGLLDRVNLREMAEEEKMSRLMTRARRGAARWRRVFMDDKTSAAEAARALGEVSSVMEAVYMYLPAGERPVYAGKMRLVEAYARLVETGRVWHRENAKSEGARAKQEVLDEVMGELERVSTVKGEALRELREGYVREVAGRKLSEVAVSMVEDAVDAVERHLVRREMDVVKRMAEALKPRKLKSGKLAPGKMSAEGYRRFARYMKMVEMSAEEKAERMEELAAKLDKESEAEKQEPIEEEMRELATFGALGSGKLADVRRGVAELIGFVRAERTSWEGRVELEKEQMAHFARVAVEAMGGVDRNKLAAKRDRAKKPLRTILGTQKGFMSLGQMWMAMQGVPALRGLAEWSLERLARGNVALGMRERALREAEVAFMAQELGLTSEAARNNFLVDLKRERATGVRKAGEKRVHKVRVTVEEAREIVAMNF